MLNQCEHIENKYDHLLLFFFFFYKKILSFIISMKCEKDILVTVSILNVKPEMVLRQAFEQTILGEKSLKST